ncbi:MAG: hypothetical protein HY658_13155 [Actinobacteria bacterium]|nr:hypothetical protein [Actinomycetota bacterium]
MRDRFLVTVGSDHHGPDPTLPDRLEAVRERAADLDPRIASIDSFVADGVPGGLPVWRGELRSSARAHLLPNVYSARVHQKHERGRVEALVERYAEPLAALVPGFPWPGEAFDRIWQLLLWNGAHDSACGCSHDLVARDVDARYAEARELAEGVVAEALDALAGHVGAAGPVWFNPATEEQGGIPPLGWRTGPPSDAAEAPVGVELDGGRALVAGTAVWLVDEGDVGDLYNFCPADPVRPAVAALSVVGDGEVRGALPDCEVLLRFTRGEDAPFVGVRATIRNERPDHRLRLHVALPERAEGSVAGSPFELVHRDLFSEGSDLEAPSPTWPGRGVVMAGGVAVLSPGVIEYEVVGGRELAVTLLRCVGTISRRSIATRPWAAGPDVATPDAQMQGTTELDLAILPEATEAVLLPSWERFALPPTVGGPAGGPSDPPAATGRLLDLEPGGAQLSGVRRVDGRLEVRLWNPGGEPVVARVGGAEVRLGPFRIATVTEGVPAR